MIALKPILVGMTMIASLQPYGSEPAHVFVQLAHAYSRSPRESVVTNHGVLRSRQPEKGHTFEIELARGNVIFTASDSVYEHFRIREDRYLPDNVDFGFDGYRTVRDFDLSGHEYPCFGNIKINHPWVNGGRPRDDDFVIRKEGQDCRNEVESAIRNFNGALQEAANMNM